MSRTLAFRIPFLVGAVFATVTSFTAIDAGMYVGQSPDAPALAQTQDVGSLIGAHGCWTGEAPAEMRGVLPGHVVVTVGGETRYAGERMVGKALEQIFDGTDHGLLVHAFCA